MFWAKGRLNIRGGRFINNIADGRGGVFNADEEGNITVTGGEFLVRSWENYSTASHRCASGGYAFVLPVIHT